MKKIFEFLFGKKWEPTLTPGTFWVCDAAELEKYIHNKTIICKILERDKNTGKNYYHVISDDFTDHHNKPVDWYIHEKNILYPFKNVEVQ